MTYQVSCNEDLGIEGCDFMAAGEIPADVLDTLLPHLRSKHNLPMPDAEAILSGNAGEETLMNGKVAKPVETVTRRLQSALHLDLDDQASASPEPVPTLGRLPNR